MSIDECADLIARRAIVPHCNAFYVSATQHQQERVIQDAKAQVLVYLKQLCPEKCSPPSTSSST